MNSGVLAKTPAARMPWKDVVAKYGPSALKAGHSHQRVSNWRRDGVPGQIVLAMEQRTQHTGVRTLTNVPSPVFSMIERLQTVWDASHQGRGIGWHVLETVVNRLSERPSQG